MIVLPVNKIGGSFQKFLTDNKDLMHRYITKRIAKAVKHNLAHIELYRLSNTEYIALVRRHQYAKNIEFALDHFINTEQYEWAAACRDILKQIEINTLINNTAVKRRKKK